MASHSQDRFQVLYMAAQNVAHHQRVAARGADLKRRSEELRERSRQARSMSEGICRQIEEYFSSSQLRPTDP